MHETGVVHDLLRAAERAAGGPPDTIRAMTVRLGALSGFNEAAVRHHVEALADARWDRSPEVFFLPSAGPTDPGASGVTLVSIRVDA